MENRVYDDIRWARARREVIERDRNCVYSTLLGGACSGPLHVHHLNPDHPDPYDPEWLVTICEFHHPKLEAVRRSLLKVRGWKRCAHTHRTRESREACERRLNGIHTPIAV